MAIIFPSWKYLIKEMEAICILNLVKQISVKLYLLLKIRIPFSMAYKISSQILMAVQFLILPAVHLMNKNIKQK
jgi:hypothetical protein